MISKNSNSPFFYFISSVLPKAGTTGGDIVLHRHFNERPYLPFRIVYLPSSKPSLFAKLETSRFRSYILTFLPWYETFDLSILKTLEKPAFIITVAHDRECFAAMKAAQYFNVPLVTIFHDWFPASSGAHPRLQGLLDNEFKKLYKASAVAFCVSRQMIEALGPHPNAMVLPPIPSETVSPIDAHLSTASPHPHLLYAGFCGGAYEGMLQHFINAAKGANHTISISGPHSQELNNQEENVQLLGFVTSQAFTTLFESADILLVFLNFNPQYKKHFSTHFPSKLIEYAGKGKMIAVWGPSYATGVQWAKETGAAFYYDGEEVTVFIEKMLHVYKNDTLRTQYIQKATEIYKHQFAPEVVDDLLKETLKKLAC